MDFVDSLSFKDRIEDLRFGHVDAWVWRYGYVTSDNFPSVNFQKYPSLCQLTIRWFNFEDGIILFMHEGCLGSLIGQNVHRKKAPWVVLAVPDYHPQMGG